MTSPKKLLSSVNLFPKRKLGQNFLADPAISEMIVARSKIHRKDIVLEIGAGLGSLTVSLAQTAKKVYAVEIDHSILPLLKSEVDSNSLDNVIILEDNILRLDLNTIAKDENCKLMVFGNLPYGISSQILIRLITQKHLISRCILMFQKELAQRISSSPGSKKYGGISVILQYCADIRSVVEVDASHFYPKPRVSSEVVEIMFKNTPVLQAKSEVVLHRVIKTAFSKRRKILKNAVAGSDLFDTAEHAKTILENVGIDPHRRAETLSVEEFVKLSNAVSDPTDE
jgi:16S rRNA (adenine1518-N6/adenine1519-N6)-dimethyltransferase